MQGCSPPQPLPLLTSLAVGPVAPLEAVLRRRAHRVAHQRLVHRLSDSVHSGGEACQARSWVAMKARPQL